MTTGTQESAPGGFEDSVFGASGLAPLADSDGFGGSPANSAKVPAGAGRGVAANRHAEVFLDC